jgi:hypothetical protein
MNRFFYSWLILINSYTVLGMENDNTLQINVVDQYNVQTLIDTFKTTSNISDSIDLFLNNSQLVDQVSKVKEALTVYKSQLELEGDLIRSSVNNVKKIEMVGLGLIFFSFFGVITTAVANDFYTKKYYNVGFVSSWLSGMGGIGTTYLASKAKNSHARRSLINMNKLDQIEEGLGKLSSSKTLK